MQVDWLTVAAQIVNFLILVWLLHKFLYGPIVRAMGDREAAIAALRQAFKLDPEGPQGEEARRQLLKLGLDL